MLNLIQNQVDLIQKLAELVKSSKLSMDYNLVEGKLDYLAFFSEAGGFYIFKYLDTVSFNIFFSEYRNLVFVFDQKNISKILAQNDLFLPSNTVDIMLAGYVENSSFPNDLHSQAARKLNQDYELEYQPSTDSLFNTEIELDSFKEMETRLKLLFDLGSNYDTSLPEKLKYLWQEVESPVSEILGKMELKGVYLDKVKLEEISAKLFEKARYFETQIREKLQDPSLNVNSTQQLATSLIKNGFDLQKIAGKGKISTDKDTLDQLSPGDNTGLIKEILEYRTVSKLYSTYTDSFLGQIDSQNRLHGQYSQAQVATGRLSSNSPNLQNIPIRNPEYGPLIRSCFTSPEGYTLVGADYSQFELRLLAHFSGDPTLINAFELNQDIHARTAAEIFEIPLAQVTKEERRVGKTLNFALVYQQGVFATSLQLGVEQKQAKAFMEKYFGRFARVKPFINEVLQKAREVGYVETFLGRRRHFQNLNSGQAMLRKAEERAAFNAVLQGSNADLIKLAMISIEKELKSKNLDGEIVLQVHDELVLEVKSQEAEEIQKIVITQMQAGQPLKVPILVESGLGKNWNECK